MRAWIVTTALMLTACAGDSPITDKPLHQRLASSEWGNAELGDAFIQFGSERKVTGHGGCNRFFGNYSEFGAFINIGPLGATKMMCSPEQMEKERKLMNAMQSALSFEITHLVLILKDKDGTPLLELQRRDWD